MDEFEALKTIDTALASLDDSTRARSLDWIFKKYGGAIAAAGGESTHRGATIQNTAGQGLNLSVASIAQRLNAKSADDVLRAAAASLTLVQGREHFPWKDLLAEAGRATGYWTKHHPSNATKALKRLRGTGVLVELANGELALSPAAKSDLTAALGTN